MFGVGAVSCGLLLLLAIVAQTASVESSAKSKVYYVQSRSTYYVWVKIDKVIFPKSPDTETWGVKYQVDGGAFLFKTGQKVASCDPQKEPGSCREYSETWSLVVHFSAKQVERPILKFQEFIKVDGETKMGKNLIETKWPKRPEKIPNAGLDRYSGAAWRVKSAIEGSVTFTITPMTVSLAVAKLYIRVAGETEYKEFPARVKEIKPVGPVEKVLGFGYEIWESAFKFDNAPRSAKVVEYYVQAAIQETGGDKKNFFKNQKDETPFTIKVGRRRMVKSE